MADSGDSDTGPTIDDYLDQFLLLSFEAYFKRMSTDRKGELTIVFGVPQELRVDPDVKQALADLMDWGGWTFRMTLTREKPINIEALMEGDDDG